MPREYQFPFELRHLVYFLEVARRLHFRRAAEALGVAQPALSRQVAQLEAALGSPLFIRSSRRVELTPAGALLAGRVEGVLRPLSGLAGEVKAVGDGRVGLVRAAFTGLAMATVLPRILRDFHRLHPGIRLALNESPTSAQLAALQAGDLDCGFFHPDSATPGLKTTELLRERNGVLLPADHPLARRSSLRLRDLASTPFVLFPRQHNPAFYDRVLGAFARAGIAPRIAEEVWPRVNGIGFVRAGIGATFLCPSEAQHLPPEVVLLPVTGPAPESRLVLGWRLQPAPSPAVSAFVAVATVNSRPRSRGRSSAGR